jgi:hypothetical protein
MREAVFPDGFNPLTPALGGRASLARAGAAAAPLFDFEALEREDIEAAEVEAEDVEGAAGLDAGASNSIFPAASAARRSAEAMGSA